MARPLPYDASRTALNYPCQPPFFAGWQPRTEAALCCELARLAYCAGNALHDPLAVVGMAVLREFTEVGTGGTSAFLAASDRAAVLAFRGTEPDDPTDVIDDARFLPAPWRGGGLVHLGFADALLRVWDQVEAALRGLTQPVVFTGHSLGAALATLAASLHPPRRLVTFGSPRVGDAAFCAALDPAVSGDRFVDCCDLVCQVPPPFPYQHFGRLHYIDRQGAIWVEPEEWRMAGDQIAAHADYLREYAWRTGNVLTRSLADHAPINYVSALAGAD